MINDGEEKLVPSPFIVGFPRSGTTLLRLMLDSHPDLAIPPETHFIPEIIKKVEDTSNQQDIFFQQLYAHRKWGDFQIDLELLKARVSAIQPFRLSEALRAFYFLYAERFRKRRWGDKSVPYISSMEVIQKYLSEARFIHIIRDGRDAALSVQNLWFGPNSIEEAARHWCMTIADARRQAQNLNYYLEILYEDLVLNTTDTLVRICEFIDLPYDHAMLEYHRRSGERLLEIQRDIVSPQADGLIGGDQRLRIHVMTTKAPDPRRIGRWKSEMNLPERESFARIAGPTLMELGYEVD